MQMLGGAYVCRARDFTPGGGLTSLGEMTNDSTRANSQGVWLGDLRELRIATAELEWRTSAVGNVNPRPPGWRNGLIQCVKRLIARGLHWYMRPCVEFDGALCRSLMETERVIHDLAACTHALDWRLSQLEKRGIEAAGPDRADCRTTYVIGLFGSGRQYVGSLIQKNIRDRAKYFRDDIRVHPGATPMIYSGHATLRHASRNQYLPGTTTQLLKSVRAGFADLIFIYRHPFDSLLTNWVWWRTYIQENRQISGISEVFDGIDGLCACLQQHFASFRAFAEGDPSFFARLPGARFLSLSEFVEETELYLQAATLALRFEDFALDPEKEFLKIAKLMGCSSALSYLHLDPPRSKPYGYLAVKEKVPQFRAFINELAPATKEGIQRLGYSLGL